MLKDLKEIEEEENKDEEEKIGDEVSFESSEQSLMEITSAGEIDIPVLNQKDLDNRVNLEDTLVGDFDCFKPEDS